MALVVSFLIAGALVVLGVVDAYTAVKVLTLFWFLVFNTVRMARKQAESSGDPRPHPVRQALDREGAVEHSATTGRLEKRGLLTRNGWDMVLLDEHRGQRRFFVKKMGRILDLSGIDGKALTGLA